MIMTLILVGMIRMIFFEDGSACDDEDEDDEGDQCDDPAVKEKRGSRQEARRRKLKTLEKYQHIVKTLKNIRIYNKRQRKLNTLENISMCFGVCC